MTITELVTLAKRVHDAEGVDLGASSTRGQRNAFWMRVVGIVYYGHPVYNPNPDPSWHVKDGGGGRPQSDDVVVRLPSREAWDCITGAGTNGYRFHADPIGVLPSVQNVYAPVRPDGSGVVTPPPHVCPSVMPTYGYPDEHTTGKAFLAGVKQAYKDAGRTFPDAHDQDAYWHFARFGYSAHWMPASEAIKKHLQELRSQLGV